MTKNSHRHQHITHGFAEKLPSHQKLMIPMTMPPSIRQNSVDSLIAMVLYSYPDLQVVMRYHQ